ncbi:MAG: HEAT repeat domain-containing protein [Bacteriovoracaceae bacterium]|nr:HEAT repeat domain-containing protein [Bacteriovoracaceae bacterium]
MKKSYRMLILLSCWLLLLSTNSFSNVAKLPPKPSKEIPAVFKDPLLAKLGRKYLQDYTTKKELIALKKETLEFSGKAVPVLIDVMKKAIYPDKNRWIATFLLGQIMGKKSAPFVAKFLEHPNWIMRMASLKTLLALKERRFGKLYSNLLKDNSLIVREQALENVNKLKLDKFAPKVWAMLYDKRNYYKVGKSKSKKRSNIIKKIIKVVGNFKFKKAKAPFYKMIQKNGYSDVFFELDYALNKITGRESPDGNMDIKRNYWSKLAQNIKI